VKLLIADVENNVAEKREKSTVAIPAKAFIAALFN
jgi:hypothetical protein